MSVFFPHRSAKTQPKHQPFNLSFSCSLTFIWINFVIFYQNNWDNFWEVHFLFLKLRLFFSVLEKLVKFLISQYWETLIMVLLEFKCLCKLLWSHCTSPYVLKSRPFHLEFKWLGKLLWSHCASPCIIPWLVMHPRKSLLFFQFEDKVYQFVKQAGFIGMQFCSMLPVSVMDHNADRLHLSAQWTNTHREIFCTWVWKQTKTQPQQENSMTDNVAIRWELPLVQAEKSFRTWVWKQNRNSTKAREFNDQQCRQYNGNCL